MERAKEAIHYRNSILEGGEADPLKIEGLVERYGKILEKAGEEYEYEPPGEYFKDGYNLYKRMSGDREDYLLFLHDLSIPPTNNTAENAARKYERKNAQTMCFRSREGQEYFCDGLSVMESMKTKGENLYEGYGNALTRRQGQFKKRLLSATDRRVCCYFSCNRV